MSGQDMSVHEALVALHSGTQRQGPGSSAFARALLDRLPDLPEGQGIADLGSGSGAASLQLAKHYGRPVLAVDLADAFLESLSSQAKAQNLSGLITPMNADMGTLDPGAHWFAMIWSEGAAYCLTFEGALKAWRPLLAEGGIAVISEMSWFSQDRPAEAAAFWEAAYPQMADEQTNLALAQKHGFIPLFTERLPVQAWWDSYYNPLLEKVAEFSDAPSPAMQGVLAETRREIDLFRKFPEIYGYTFYVLQAGC